MNDDPLQVINTVFRIAPEAGGIARTVLHASEGLADRHGLECLVFSTDPTLSFGNLSDPPTRNLPAASARVLANSMMAEAKPRWPCICHDHGQWMPINVAASVISRRLNLPRVVSPHGMLRDWAFAHKRFKKRIAWWVFGKELIRSADAIHVASEFELADLHKRGLKERIHVIPLGIEMPALPPKRFSQTGPRRALFLSRVHRVKGIALLLQAWAAVAPNDWELIIAGPDDEGIIRNTDLPRACTYVGPVDSLEKWRLYQSADLFVLPTFTENFGLAIGEALYAGVPVITTRAAPWPAVQSEKLGWWIDTGLHPLLSSLRQATAATRSELDAMGRRAAIYVRSNLSTAAYVDRMFQLYASLANAKSKPDGEC